MTVSELRKQYIAGTLSPTTVVKNSLRVIKEKDAEIHAFLDTYADEAMALAKVAEQEYKNKRENTPALLGIPVALKNNILVEGKRATAGSKMLENYIASYDATIVTRLKKAGAIIIGATNMDEFAMGGSTENSAFGPTKNPHDLSRVPGGSSGGSAAAVAMGAVSVAIGTDTGGSVRQPASYCGVVGLKPTYGAVSRYGLVAMGSSLDQAGPLVNTVADAELIHNIMSGLDSHDATTITPDTYPNVPLKEHYTFGVPRDFLGVGVDADVLANFEAHIAVLKDAGHTVVDIELPLFEQGLAAYYIVMPAEVSSNLARYDGMRYGLSIDGKDLLEVYEQSRATGFGAEVKRRILLGTYVLSSGYYDAYYGKAELVRHKMRAELEEVFKRVDIILTPTAPTAAFKFGAQSDPLSMYRQDIFTVPVNLTGVPAISFPMGTVEQGGIALPVGLQYIGPHGGELRLFDIGKQVYDVSLNGSK
ncbi:Asp-tRNA(Asn)/Glu-tRNA(Gln) amidotransferase GatCAB subunit A [Candidatus Collierbacteria bacterium CG10_big_fil_rev_8_21_14_0_10_44_9]|uniref:Glutamyl-tRNA(Gln) amidotransferase subunit A n=1 Tax=Candidatus Collierbacteria bacterium CG10_big_fil_rev_8_21_14_0_10_44_9 TaxID=1974535 RepID=A0A2H0VIE0_9BACT|nr:MAG: Asp-tRNA(Asn)/Glu-tRNA(Gln) amidotransferase GatCAB subunit A [Candidatus Collierbacteria bacterium CG10_big_fil_rev_8_21_14_0_10_44_9]